MFLFGFEEVIHVVVADDLGMGANGVGVLGAAVGVGGLPWPRSPCTRWVPAAAADGSALSGVLLGLPMMTLAIIDNTVIVRGARRRRRRRDPRRGAVHHAAPADLPRAFARHRLWTAGLGDGGYTDGGLDRGAGARRRRGAELVAGRRRWRRRCLERPARAALNRLAVRVDADRRRLAPLVQRLRRLGIFGDASHAALERIARATTPLSVPAGTVIFRQDDVLDDLYVIDAGEVAVSTSAQGEVNRLRRRLVRRDRPVAPRRAPPPSRRRRTASSSPSRARSSSTRWRWRRCCRIRCARP